MDKYIFGITGGSGAGKSTVSRKFRELGVFVSDADMAARAVVSKGSACLDEIRLSFGDEVILDNGELDRKRLGQIVFSDKNKLELLNNITHKYIKEYIEKEINSSDSDICAVDGAVIIGSPVMELCSSMVVVTADEDVRINRIMLRDGIDRKYASDRIRSQKDDKFYLSHADYIVENNGEDQELGVKIERIYSKIKDAKKAECQKEKTTAEIGADTGVLSCNGCDNISCSDGTQDRKGSEH